MTYALAPLSSFELSLTAGSHSFWEVVGGGIAMAVGCAAVVAACVVSAPFAVGVGLLAGGIAVFTGGGISLGYGLYGMTHRY